MDDVPPIVKVLQHYFPDWRPPKATRYKWAKCLCPFHAEARPSASVSFELNAFNCFGCDAKGDVLAIIMRKEGIPFGEAVRTAEKILGGCLPAVSQQPKRQPRRRTFGDQRTDESVDRGQGGGVSPRIRRRSPPWA
jgi:DNA primase